MSASIVRVIELLILNFELRREAKGREDSKVYMESADRLNKEVRKQSWNQQTGSIKRSANGHVIINSKGGVHKSV